ncbi:MAG TPA: GNAT family protein, partial [Candidatus Dormibacteraeota bacterium]|nr:GNAT family protein [Candidatus Dormibacteraeota bacterium]
MVPNLSWPANPSIPLIGAAAILEPLDKWHREPLWTIAQDPRIWEWLPVRADLGIDVFNLWFDARLAAAKAETEAPFAVIDARTSQVVGHTSFADLSPQHRRAEIGWTWYSRKAWGTAINPACKRLLLSQAFDALRCQRVELKTNALNLRSRAAIEKIGGRFEGVFRKHMVFQDDRVRDTAWYAIVDEEWPEVR